MNTMTMKTTGFETTANMITNVSRRGFFKATLGGAAGLALAFSLPEESKAQFGGPGPATNKPNAYIHIG
ncbi:twin-arginine translocation signal domain-containing protein, partial [Klebsiella pneumoniae]|uniref:twin-arginine translocation signal domain-containing protein n=1 Tax=Klebsiella pneumoniae TaxID=573 RepID=UPI0030138966